MDGRTRHMRQLTELIERRGWALQGVVGDPYPGQVDVTYTVGNTTVGLPELLVIGIPTGLGGHLLDHLTEVLRAGALDPRPGAVVPGPLVGLDPPGTLRLGQVAGRWAIHYGVIAYEHHLANGGHPEDVAFLQVVLPDHAGRFHGEPGYDALGVDTHQPDLSEPGSPWRYPYVPPVDLVWPPPGDAMIVVPVIEPHHGDLGRREVVPAEALGDDHYRLVRPPVLADWVTTDTEVRATEPAEPPFPDVLVGRVYEQVTRTSPQAHLVWLLHAHDPSEHGAILARTIPDLDLPETTWVDTPLSLHVATPPRFAARLRSRLRHLARDGLVVEREPYHRPVEPGLSCGPWCVGYEGP